MSTADLEGWELPLAGTAEIGLRASVSHGTVSTWVLSELGFPAPLITLRGGAVFWWPHVWPWIREHRPAYRVTGPSLEPPEGLDLVGSSEIAQRAGVRSSAVSNWRTRSETFPLPVAPLRMGPVFRWEPVQQWLANRGTYSRVV